MQIETLENIDTLDLQDTSPLRWYQNPTRHAIVRLLLVIVMVFGTMALSRFINSKLFGSDHMYLRNAINVIVTLGAYWLYVHLIEKRQATELTLWRALPEFGAGILVASGLCVAVVSILSLLGMFHIDGVNYENNQSALYAMLDPLAKFMVVALMEELFFRAILFRMIEASLGSIGALLISALLFGFAHSYNDGATIYSSLAIAIEAGFTFGVAYMLTRRLALCVGMHLAWNFTQGAIFSVAVSGTEGKGWLKTHMTGSDWLTGGSFGVEASVVTVLLMTAVGLIFFILAKRKGHFIYGFWQKQAVPAQRTADPI
ncbi:lysostaphin resistance A-like protein [Undibacterium sp. TJN19]|uniref:CPBP family intramembrane glutamic endopeptidase n=1 Tax=Undibacterium sp. TJN19 TaxID=3413055 RepID=UPI003BF030FD